MGGVERIRRAVFLAVICLGLAAGGILFAACSDDDGGSGVEIIGAEPDAEPDPEADPEAEPAAGVVEAKPAGATQVDIVLREWELSPRQRSVRAGKIYFLVDNEGPEDAHEFVVIRTDLAPGDLPVEDGKVPEDEVDLIDEIEPFAPRSQASIVLDLEPGKYVFICNIAEEEDGELESHYQLGMRAAFEVTE